MGEKGASPIKRWNIKILCLIENNVGMFKYLVSNAVDLMLGVLSGLVLVRVLSMMSFG